MAGKTRGVTTIFRTVAICNTRGRLDIQPFERSLLEETLIGDTVQGHATRQAQVLGTGDPVQVPGQVQDRLIGDAL